MNVNLTGQELVHLLEVATKSPMGNHIDQESLLNKLRSTIILVLDKEDKERNSLKFERWNQKEEKRIDKLKEMNESLFSPTNK